MASWKRWTRRPTRDAGSRPWSSKGMVRRGWETLSDISRGGNLLPSPSMEKLSSSSPFRRSNSSAFLPETDCPDARSRVLSSATVSDLGLRRDLAMITSVVPAAFAGGLGLVDVLELGENMSEMSCCCFFFAGVAGFGGVGADDCIFLERELWK